MATCEKILIAGFSGSGKSALLQTLKEDHPQDWQHFEDLDDLVLRKHGFADGKLADLIGRNGWEKFRLWERQELEGWLKNEGKGVLSLGGGSLGPVVLEMLAGLPQVKLLFLHSDFETCWQRLMGDADEPRPLVLKGKDELRKIYRQRQKDYQEAHLRLNNPEGEDLRKLARRFWSEVLAP